MNSGRNYLIEGWSVSRSWTLLAGRDQVKDKRCSVAQWLGLMIVCGVWCSTADGADNEQTVALVYDNDVFLGTDLLYTSGVHLDYVSGYLDHFADGFIPRVVGDAAESLPLLSQKGDERFIGYNLTQIIDTPEDVHASDPDPHDLPYSGYLLFTTTFIAQREHSMDDLGVTIGILGPHSFAEKSQNEFHKFIGNKPAAGWSHQLHDEPILNVAYERRHRLYQCSWNDMLVSFNGAVGNFDTEVGSSVAFRLGWHLPDDYFMPPPYAAEDSVGSRPWTRTSFNQRTFVELSLSANATALFYASAFNGNVFGNSPHVDYRPWIVTTTIDLLAVTGRFAYLLSLTEIKLPYDPPDHRHWDRYGRFGVGWAF
jgi:lipid A 3-O-deacylase